ncbi:hypothetical protein ACOME3_008734 [Neoechinorhynchus agilis]
MYKLSSNESLEGILSRPSYPQIKIILFEMKNIPRCRKLKHELKKIVEQGQAFYYVIRIDITKFPKLCRKFHILGVPCAVQIINHSSENRHINQKLSKIL